LARGANDDTRMIAFHLDKAIFHLDKTIADFAFDKNGPWSFLSFPDFLSGQIHHHPFFPFFSPNSRTPSFARRRSRASTALST
jgi:hypothetical protein